MTQQSPGRGNGKRPEKPVGEQLQDEASIAPIAPIVNQGKAIVNQGKATKLRPWHSEPREGLRTSGGTAALWKRREVTTTGDTCR